MVSIIIHAVLGIAVIVAIVASNPQIFRQPVSGPKVSVLEAVYYVVGIVATVLGYYFNIRYVHEYAHGSTNPIWGEHGSWREFIALGYANPAASSASQDYTIGNVILLPLFTIVDGRRRGVHNPWLYFVSSLFTSFGFGWAFYLATVERQRRIIPAREPAALQT